MQEVGKDTIKRVFPNRQKDAHKGIFGHLLIVGGSKFYTGAPGLAARAALRAGVDLVTVAAPERAADSISRGSFDYITWPLEGDYVKKKHLKEILALLHEKKAFVVGNGLWGYMFGDSSRVEVQGVVREVLREASMPGVLDAEAIYALKDLPNDISLEGKVLTPHGYEFCRLIGIEADHVGTEKRINSVREIAQQFGCVVLLKGSPDVISDGETVVVNTTGNPYMTKAGTGDILAGVVGSLLAQGIDPFLAAQAGAYLVGEAGDKVAKKKKQALLASDVIEELVSGGD